MEKKRKTEDDGLPEYQPERDGQPVFRMPPGKGFKHFLQHCSYQTNGPDITDAMIKMMNNNPNCYDIERNPSKLDLTKKEEDFIKHNLSTLLPLEDKVRKPKKAHKKERFHATHLETRALNTIRGGIEWKRINYKQIQNREFLLNTLRPEIDELFTSIASYTSLAHGHGVDLFKLYLSIPKDGRWRDEILDWDAVEIIWPLSAIMEDLRDLYRNLPINIDRKKGITEWREAGDDSRHFQDAVVTLIQVLWLGVHPFR